MTQRTLIGQLLQALAHENPYVKESAFKALDQFGGDLIPSLERIYQDDPDTRVLLSPILERLRKKRILQQWKNRTSSLGRWFGTHEFEVQSPEGHGTAWLRGEERPGTISLSIRKKMAPGETEIQLICLPNRCLTPLYYWRRTSVRGRTEFQGAWFKKDRVILRGRIRRVISIPDSVSLDVCELFLACTLPLSKGSTLEYPCLRTDAPGAHQDPQADLRIWNATESRTLGVQEDRAFATDDEPVSFWRIEVHNSSEPRSFWVTEDHSLVAAQLGDEKYYLRVEL